MNYYQSNTCAHWLFLWNLTKVFKVNKSWPIVINVSHSQNKVSRTL